MPLPLSLLSPVPFSDPHLHLVQLSTSQPSDPPDLRPHDRLTAAASSTPQQPPLKAYEDEKMNKEQKVGRNNPSKQSHSGAVADYGVTMVSLPSSPSNRTKVTILEGRWCDGDKAIPLKKRKASFEMNGMVVTGESKMKSKTNKKCPLAEDPGKADENDYDDDDDNDYEEDDNSDSDNDNNKRKRKGKKSSIGARMKTTKKKKKGGSLMEGSRCSRVNGRGWRCMQPTLVGYALCEHHLGKGRLRSMSSVRARSTKITSTLLSQLPPPPDQEKSCNAETPKQEESTIRDYDDDDDDDEKRPISAGNGRKRTRIGMVKARSLSSLLCLPNTTTTSVVQIGATSANQAT